VHPCALRLPLSCVPAPQRPPAGVNALGRIRDRSERCGFRQAARLAKPFQRAELIALDDFSPMKSPKAVRRYIRHPRQPIRAPPDQRRCPPGLITLKPKPLLELPRDSAVPSEASLFSRGEQRSRATSRYGRNRECLTEAEASRQDKNLFYE